MYLDPAYGRLIDAQQTDDHRAIRPRSCFHDDAPKRTDVYPGKRVGFPVEMFSMCTCILHFDHMERRRSLSGCEQAYKQAIGCSSSHHKKIRTVLYFD